MALASGTPERLRHDVTETELARGSQKKSSLVVRMVKPGRAVAGPVTKATLIEYAVKPSRLDDLARSIETAMIAVARFLCDVMMARGSLPMKPST